MTSAFQRLMLRWEDDHPFNCIDIPSTTAPVDRELLRAAAIDTLVAFEMPLPERVEVREVFGSVTDEAAAEMNRSFADSDPPVRLWVVREGSVTHVGFTFRHWRWDSETGSAFVRRVMLRVAGASQPAWVMRPQQVTARRGLVSLVRDLLRMKRVQSRSGMADESREVSARFIDDVPIPRHDRGVTVNDILLCRLAKGIRAVDGEGQGKRSRLAIVVAASLRDGNPLLAKGVAIGSFPIFVDQPELGLISAATLRAKSSDVARRLELEASLGNLVLPFVRRSMRERFLARQFVLSAGLSNARLRGDADFEALLSGYRRVVPVGPLLPVIVGVVTVGTRMSLSITWRRSRFSEREIDRLAETLSAEP